MEHDGLVYPAMPKTSRSNRRAVSSKPKSRAHERRHPTRGKLQLQFTRPSLVEWLCLLAGVVMTVRYAWLMDDAFIYFRYVDNAVFLKLGLVYNLGEYVEGFSSPLWAMLLLLLRSTGLGYWTITRVVGVLAFVVVWYGLVVLNRRLSPHKAPIVNLPLCWVAVNYGALSSFTSGLETPLVQIAAVGFALFAVAPDARWLQAALALAPLVRHELAAVWLVAWVGLWIFQRRIPLRMAVWAVVLDGAWLLFRIVYYADLLPNTFYLKDGTYWKQGWLYLKDTVLVYWVVPILVLAALGLVILHRRWRARAATAAADEIAGEAAAPGGHAVARAISRAIARATTTTTQSTGTPPTQASFGQMLHLRARLWMVVFALPVLLYVTRIGGGHLHYRYLASPMVLLLCAGAGIPEHLLHAWTGWRARLGAAMTSAVILIAVGLAHPRQLSSHPMLGRVGYHLVDNIEDAAVHRYHKDLWMPKLGGDARLELKDKYREALRKQPQFRYEGVSISLWCAALYRDFNARAVHNLGLTEPILAHVAMKADRPGHKLGLLPLAADIAQILRAYRVSGPPQPGLYEQAVRDGKAPAWVAHNLSSIELIERKAFNRHRLWENLKLAFTRVPRLIIRPGDVETTVPPDQQRPPE